MIPVKLRCQAILILFKPFVPFALIHAQRVPYRLLRLLHLRPRPSLNPPLSFSWALASRDSAALLGDGTVAGSCVHIGFTNPSRNTKGPERSGPSTYQTMNHGVGVM